MCCVSCLCACFFVCVIVCLVGRNLFFSSVWQRHHQQSLYPQQLQPSILTPTTTTYHYFIISTQRRHQQLQFAPWRAQEDPRGKQANPGVFMFIKKDQRVSLSLSFPPLSYLTKKGSVIYWTASLL